MLWNWLVAHIVAGKNRTRKDRPWGFLLLSRKASVWSNSSYAGLEEDLSLPAVQLTLLTLTQSCCGWLNYNTCRILYFIKCLLLKWDTGNEWFPSNWSKALWEITSICGMIFLKIILIFFSRGRRCLVKLACPCSNSSNTLSYF